MMGKVLIIENGELLRRYSSNDSHFVIPDCVTEICWGAFWDCSSLTSITIPASVTSIMWQVFSGCDSLASITVEQGNPIYHSAGNCIIETKSKTLIAGCKNSVIPDDGSVTSIGCGAFYNCRSLASINIPDSITSIGSEAFSGCISLTNITIPNSVTSIGSEAFSGTNLTQKENSIGYVDKWVVDCDTSLEQVQLRNNTVGIADEAFKDCDSLTSITIPDCVTSIGDCTFEWCISLTSITIPAGLTIIADKAFYNCEALASITIPENVTSIGEGVFEGCSSLENITVEQGNPIYHSEGNCIIETASKTLIAGCKNSVIPADGSVTSIGDRAFSSCNLLTSITIPDSVTSIGDSAFWGCESLTSITIPDSVTRIDSWAFSWCDSLTNIVIPNSVTSIGIDAFQDCSSLKTIEYTGTEEQWEKVDKGEDWKPENAQVICTGAFYGNSKSI